MGVQPPRTARKKITNASGDEITMVYDAGRLTEKHYSRLPYNDVTYRYENGRVVEVTDGSGRQEISYDHLGNMSKNIRTFATKPCDNLSSIFYIGIIPQIKNIYYHLYKDNNISNSFIGYHLLFSLSPTALKQDENGMFLRVEFTGKETDCETGFSYFGARYYDPTLLTSWTAVDPMSDDYPNISPYHYCHWNPIRLTDPTGMSDDGWEVNLDNNTIRKTSCEGGLYEQHVTFIGEGYENYDDAVYQGSAQSMAISIGISIVGNVASMLFSGQAVKYTKQANEWFNETTWKSLTNGKIYSRNFYGGTRGQLACQSNSKILGDINKSIARKSRVASRIAPVLGATIGGTITEVQYAQGEITQRERVVDHTMNGITTLCGYINHPIAKCASWIIIPCYEAGKRWGPCTWFENNN